MYALQRILNRTEMIPKKDLVPSQELRRLKQEDQQMQELIGSKLKEMRKQITKNLSKEKK